MPPMMKVIRSKKARRLSNSGETGFLGSDGLVFAVMAKFSDPTDDGNNKPDEAKQGDDIRRDRSPSHGHHGHRQGDRPNGRRRQFQGFGITPTRGAGRRFVVMR